MVDPKPTRKRKPVRDSDSGKFASPEITDDDRMYGQVVVWVRAITQLEPMLACMALEMDDPADAKAMATVGATLSVLKQSFIQQMSVDSESRKDAKQLAIDAERLGCIPMAEQAKVMGVVDRWMALPREKALGGSAVKPAIKAPRAGGES